MKKFIKIIARYIPDDLVTYKEYVGKPYYEIMYEENGEVIVGFGSFKIDCISEWINEYFINNKIDEVLEIIENEQENFGVSAYEAMTNVYNKVVELREGKA